MKPDASKIVVPKGYKVEVFAADLDSASAATVDGEDNVWVAISGNLFGPFEYEYGGQRIKNPIPGPHVKVFDKTGKHLKDIGLGTFKTVMNEIGYCAENKKVYIPEYRTHIWEIDGVNGELRKIITDLPGGDHEIGGITCKDGYLYWGQGLPSNTGFADPDNHGWTEEVDPFWQKHGDPALPKTKRDPVCREIVHTGLNVRSADGRMTGALLPVGVPAKPGMVIKPTVPCGGSIMRVALNKQGSDGMFKHEEMEVYAFGFRNQSGVAFGPKGSRFENALAVSDNGANDLGHRRVANGAEKLFIVTEKGQDAGFPDKEGFNFVTNKRFSLRAYNGAAVDRPHPQLYIGDKPWVPQLPPYRLPPHVEGVRGVPLIVANPNPNGYINPVLEWDTNNPHGRDRVGRRAVRRQGHALRGGLRRDRQRPRERRPDVAGDPQDRVPAAGRRQVVVLPAERGHGAERVPEAGESRRPRAHQRRRLRQRRQDPVRRRLRRAVRRLLDAVALLPDAEVERDLEGDLHRELSAGRARGPRAAHRVGRGWQHLAAAPRTGPWRSPASRSEGCLQELRLGGWPARVSSALRRAAGYLPPLLAPASDTARGTVSRRFVTNVVPSSSVH